MSFTVSTALGAGLDIRHQGPETSQGWNFLDYRISSWSNADPTARRSVPGRADCAGVSVATVVETTNVYCTSDQVLSTAETEIHSGML